MPFDLITIPCLSDNYAFLLHDQASGEVAVVDVPDAAPIKVALAEKGWTLTQVWLTHHHGAWRTGMFYRRQSDGVGMRAVV